MEDVNKKSISGISKVRQLSRYMVRQLGMLSNSSGVIPLSPVQAHSLSELGQQPLSVKLLASKLNVDKSNASRAISHLVNKNLAQTQVNPRDHRSLVAKLTPQGRKTLTKLENQQNGYFSEILAQLSTDEIAQIETSLSLYNRAIDKAKAQQAISIRPLLADDDAGIANVIRQVSQEFGLTEDKGYSVADPDLDQLSEVYNHPKSCYWVVIQDQKVVGGAGIAPLKGKEEVAELQKMYFMPNIRDLGLGKRLALDCIKFAKSQGFSHCYLETTAELTQALKLYETLGFKQLDAPLGETGHDDCEIPMLLTL